MPVLLSLALRNLARHRARTALTAGAILFGAFAGTLLGGVLLSFQRTMADDVVLGRTGALQVYRAGYFDNRASDPLKLDLPQGGDLERRIRAVPGVRELAPRLVFNALASNGETSAMALATGVDARAERAVLPHGANNLRGAMPGEKGPGSAVLGAKLAQALGLQDGATWTLQAATVDGRQNAWDFELAGLDEPSNFFESGLKALVPLEQAQRLVRMPGRVTAYVVAVQDGADADQVAAALRRELGPDYDVRSWRELATYVADVFFLQKVIFGAISAIFLVVAIIGVMNTMIMNVLERTREIGMMMAAGLRRRLIAALFVLEAALMGAAGGAGGALLANLVARGLRARGGLEFKFPGGTVPMHLVPVVPAQHTLVVVGVLFLGALAAAAWPALRAARLTPADALRDA